MKILYSAAGTPIPGTHGGSIHALELCRALARRGHEVHLAALRPSLSGGAEIPLDGVQMRYLHRFLPVTLLEWTAGQAIRSLIAEIHPDVVVERFYTFGGGAIAAAHHAGVPAVLEINSPARDYPGSLRDTLDKLTIVRPVDRWRRRQLERCAAVYTTSRHLVPPELQDSATVIVNGVDVDRFTPGPETPDTGPLHCAYVSSFRSWHGAEDLVEAVSHCVSRGVPLRVMCIGEGPRWKLAKEAAAVAGIADNIDFVGRVPHAEIPGLLADADIGMAPFAPDQFRALELGWFWSPIKIFEYLAAGLPVVTADIEELRTLLQGGVANFYRAADPLALAEAIMELEADRAAVRRMSKEARSLAEQRYTWDHQAEAVDDVLNRVLLAAC
jgi:glycosyltransferase involved in cell wall biosynthesis